jgi:hypothetical protein
MYRVRRWNHDRDEMTEKFVDVLDGISVDGYVSVTRIRPLTWFHEEQGIPVLEAGPGGVRRFEPRWPTSPSPRSRRGQSGRSKGAANVT